MGRRPKGLGAVLLVVGLVAGANVVAPAGAREAAGDLQVPNIDWKACGGPYECAQAPVPLDYDDPHGPTIPIALIRLPASDPSRRIGSLFTNPGGPGGSGVDLIRSGAAQVVWTDAVRARFDIIGFDPRGVARSRPLQCFASSDEAERFFDSALVFPHTESQQAPFIAFAARLGQLCLERGGAIIRHMSTANVARDMDLLRRAVGDDKLSYDGISYGSLLGSVYAALFPNRVRALVIDGVADPVSWFTGRPPHGPSIPVFTRIGSAHGSEDSLRQFTKLCDAAGPASCPLAPRSRAKLDRLGARLLQGAIVFGPDRVTYDRYVDTILGGLYVTTDWAPLSELAAGLYDFTFNTGSPASGVSFGTARGFVYDNYGEAGIGIACSEVVSPHDPSAWPRAVARQEANGAPFFAADWAWTSEYCAAWPATDEDRYQGPFDRVTSAPVLLIQNRHDPATPYHGALAVDAQLPRSRLLTLNGNGHTTWLNKSSCIDRHREDYLIRGALPPVGTTCQPDFQPFTDAASSAAAARISSLFSPTR
jgi:pimeloyl-ACP methyl ester carboxylesterase